MYITLAEAASLLDVTKETLRNWDKCGKLTSIRDPNNNYRLYKLSEVQALGFLGHIQEARSFGQCDIHSAILVMFVHYKTL